MDYLKNPEKTIKPVILLTGFVRHFCSRADDG